MVDFLFFVLRPQLPDVESSDVSVGIHVFFAGQGVPSVVYPGYISKGTTLSCGKMDLSRRVGPPKRPFGVAHRLFGVTKLLSARLDWPLWIANAGYLA